MTVRGQTRATRSDGVIARTAGSTSGSSPRRYFRTGQSARSSRVVTKAVYARDPGEVRSAYPLGSSAKNRLTSAPATCRR